MLGEALERQADVTWIVGGRRARAVSALRWLLTCDPHAVDAAYVELSTSAVTPVDLLLLGWLRLRGRRVGIYFRDAYQLFRALFPIRGIRQHVADLVWRATTPLVKRLATDTFVPSTGLAEVLGIGRPILLPPACDPDLPNIGAGTSPLVAAIATLGPSGGTALLIDAVALVRRRVPDVRLLIIGRGVLPPPVPEWVSVTTGSRDDLPRLLGPARAVAIPLPITSYTNLAVPVRLMDLLALGKPIVATRSRETARLLEGHDAALLVDDRPAAMAEELERLLRDPALPERLASNARALATTPGWRWDDRAATVLGRLVPTSE
ncbi:MAG TPA: glycosyltransferase [Candidatus Limnocylindrales bacterium]|nr:glycosyltransferase [Candidatus Limnocylindrales bacterium]